MSFVSASTFEPVAPGEYRGVLTAEWAQGRGVVGGLVAAILARALEADAPPGQALATLTVAFCAPATEGAATIRTEIVRAGRHVSVLRADLTREGTTFATALATVARPRGGTTVYHGWCPPPAPPPEDVADGPPVHYLPAFTRFLELRQCLGPVPFTGGNESRVGGWCRLRERGVAVDRALACLLLDAWPPAAAAMLPVWCPVASLEMTCDFLAPQAIVSDEWLLYEARAGHIEGGLADEEAVLWTREGRAVARSRQRIAIFPAPEGGRSPLPDGSKG
jgi:acyl-CoA thioesterase